MDNLTILCPASLLLCGEYFILEKEGKGLAVALNIYTKITLKNNKDKHFKLRSKIKDSIIEYNKGEKIPEFLEFSIRIIENIIKDYNLKDNFTITLDTSDFYYYDNDELKKKGLGSSASVLVGILKAISQINNFYFNLDYALSLNEKVLNKQVSGYDIATSFFGGIILFCKNNIKKINFPFDFSIELKQGQKPISSLNSIEKYIKNKNKKTIKLFIKSNNLVSLMSEVTNFKDFIFYLFKLKEISNELGDLIGVNSRVNLDIDDFYKASGAGDELIFIIKNKKDDLINYTGVKHDKF